MEKRTTNEGIKRDYGERKGIKAIGGNKIIGAFLLNVFQSFAEGEDGYDQIDEIGKGIDGLTYQALHIGILAKELIDTGFCLEMIPESIAVIYVVKQCDQRSKYAGSDDAQ